MDRIAGFFQMQIGPFPLWIWIVVIGGGIALALFIRKRSSGSNLGTSGTPTAPALDSSVYDPSTGIPLAVETATNPATGLPNYNSLVSLGQTTNGIAASQGSGSAVAGFNPTTNTYTVGQGYAGNTIDQLSSYFHLRYGGNDIWGNPNNASLVGAIPGGYGSAGGSDPFGFQAQLPAGSQVYIPPSQVTAPPGSNGSANGSANG